ncbi:AAA family ATPase [Haloactinospora alba]|uniref:AAA family ATPase n=1 Tax=Haloactinospora alba TaxID=405555 RepID=UPI00114EB970|nr:ATP-binding protein [Haloactinospora alba]
MHAPAANSALIGREAELQSLLSHARTGSGATLLLGGDAGVGKSRLLTEFTTRTPAGSVVTGGCLELGSDGVPFAPFLAVLRQLLREHGRAPFETVSRGGEHELARLLPELGPVPDTHREGRGVLFEQVLRLLTAASAPDGLTVVLEDLHWADSATQDLLVFLVRNLDASPVQLVATYRSDELHRDRALRRCWPSWSGTPPSPGWSCRRWAGRTRPGRRRRSAARSSVPRRSPRCTSARGKPAVRGVVGRTDRDRHRPGSRRPARAAAVPAARAGRVRPSRRPGGDRGRVQ